MGNIFMYENIYLFIYLEYLSERVFVKRFLKIFL